MPWQGHLLIGQRVSDWYDVVKVYHSIGVHELDELGTKLNGASTPEERDEIEEYIQEFIWDELQDVKRKIWHKGIEFEVNIEFQHEAEGGTEFPSRDDYGEYTDAAVYFSLTSRYRGAVLDAKHEHGGRPEPFEFDPQDILDILIQVRKWWPEAQALIWTEFY
jgi:hypothetical protein